MTKAVRYIFLLSLSACSTVGEMILDQGSALDYHKQTTEDGKTKYVRQRLVSPFDKSPHFSLDPWPPPNNYTPATESIDFPRDPSPTVTYQQNSYSPSSMALSLTALGSKQTANLDANIEWLSDYISGGVGISYVGSDYSYFGFDGVVRAHLPWSFSPFVGVGLYAGDSKSCTYEPIGDGYNIETCEKYFLTTSHLDWGLQIRSHKFFITRVFARSYANTRQGDPLADTLYGASFAFTF